MTNKQIIDTLFPVRPDANAEWRMWTEHERIGAAAMAKAKDGIFRAHLERILITAADPGCSLADLVTAVNAAMTTLDREEVAQ